MSAILSTDDLNDFINPGVACIKPVETLPLQQPTETLNEYEVTTEDKIASTSKPPPAQISLTDCLACSGCVTSAEAVLVSLQSHGEVLDTLDKYHELRLPGAGSQFPALSDAQAKIFVASVSPQARASLAATYGVSERQAGNMIDQLLRGPQGVRSGGQHGSGFAWVIDTNAMREASLVAAADEVAQSTQDEAQKKPVITSACPGWICYAEKTHPHILPHLSKLKSPQALTGVLVKSVLSKKYGIPPQNIWHLAVMPCFDKKLEASRSELTSHSWHGQTEEDAVRDVDCVITARELLMLAESRNISFPRLPKRPVTGEFAPSFADPGVDSFLFAPGHGQKRKREDVESIGTSGGYLHHILKTRQVETPGSTISFQRGRNTDVAEYSVLDPSGQTVFKAARYYGFRNIQNLVRRLKPAKASRMPGAAARKVGTARRPGAAAGTSADGDYAYVEVMACPGGCTNGGGQIKVGDVATLRQAGGTGIVNGEGLEQEVLPAQREWLAKVDEAYWSADTDDGENDDGGNATREGISPNASHRNNNSTTKDHDGDITMSNDPSPSSSSSTSPARDSVLSTDTDNNPSGSSSSSKGEDLVDGISRRRVRDFLAHWSDLTGIELDVLLKTTYRVVESDVGKNKSGGSDVDRVNALAHAAGGGW